MLKKLIIISGLALLSFAATSQNASVEDRIWGLNLGVANLTGYGEYKLSDHTTLRGELSLAFGFQASRGNFYYAIGPVAVIEPRWYYNLDKRSFKMKRVEGNSGNFLALQVDFVTESLIYSNEKRSSVYRDINDVLSFIPMWGMRRQYNHFAWEIGLGAGLGVDFEGGMDVFPSYNLEARIGYVFKKQ
jgi:hypothetical protein